MLCFAALIAGSDTNYQICFQEIMHNIKHSVYTVTVKHRRMLGTRGRISSSIILAKITLLL